MRRSRMRLLLVLLVGLWLSPVWAQAPTADDLAQLATRAAKRAELEAQSAAQAVQAAALSEYLATLATQAAQAAQVVVPPAPVPAPVPPPPPALIVTLAATPMTVLSGQSSTLTLLLPTENYHNIFINGVRPACVTTATMQSCLLTVVSLVTTVYQAAATDAGGIVYVMPSVTVTVSP